MALDPDDWLFTTTGVNATTFAAPAAPAGVQSGWVLQTIYIEPENPSVPAGETVQFEALGIYEGGHEQPETDAIIWRSTDPKTVSFDNTGKRGLATIHKAGEVTVSVMEPNSKKIAVTKLHALPPEVSQMSDEDLDKGEAYRLGIADGKLDDPENRWQMQVPEKRELLAAYDKGFKEGQEEADKKWDKAGADVDGAPSSKTPEEGQPGFSEYMDGAGIVISIISALEAKSAILKAGGSIVEAGAVGTTVGTLLLPVFAFMLGTAIAQRREEYKAAVDLFVAKFITLTLTQALDRARAMVKNTEGGIKEINDQGQAASKEIYEEMESKLNKTLRDYVDDKVEQPKYEALYKTWVLKLSKQYANLLANPRYLK